MPLPVERVIKPLPVERKLNDITKSVVASFNITYGALRSAPVKVVVVVTCADGLSYEYARQIDH